MGSLWTAKNIKIMVATVAATLAACVCIAVIAALALTRYGGLDLSAATAVPVTGTNIQLMPDSGYAGTELAVRGENWRPGEVIFIRLQNEAGQIDENYAYAGAVADENGQFNVSFVYPYDPQWAQGNAVQVLARAEASGMQAIAPFRLVQPTVMATPTQDATVAPTPLVMPTTAPGVPTVQPQPTAPLPPAPPAPPPPPEPTITEWRGAYFSNPNLQGNPTLIRNDSEINFEWGMGSPAAGFPADNFSVQWTRSMGFDEGNYRFFARVDDGVRLWIDNQLVIDQWHDSGPVSYVAEVYLSPGMHTLRMDYYERIGWSVAQLRWERLQASYPDWKGEYFNNPNLAGGPVLVRNDAWIDFNWGSGSPGPNVPSDNFSARWTRAWRFDSGDYRLYVKVDDGARLWVDGQLLIDQWRDSGLTTYVAERHLDGGDHRLQLEYYDRTGSAEIHLWWERLETSFPDWKGEYFDNRHLQGSPVLVRNDARPDFNWNLDAPGPGVPSDDFSVRWTRNQRFDETGSYRFYARVDDGVRVWVGGDLVIDSWKNGSERVVSGTKWIDSGEKYVKIEYYDSKSSARITVWWERESATSTPVPPRPTSTSAPPPPPSTATTAPVPTETSEVIVTPTPPVTDVPVQPSIELSPEAGQVDVPFVVHGTNWPAGQTVAITFAKALGATQIQVDPNLSVANVGVSEDGSFETTVAVPAGQGWETEPEVLVVAYTSDMSSSSVKRYTILTEPAPTDEAGPTQEPGEPTPAVTEAPVESPTEEGQPPQEPTAEPTAESVEPTAEPAEEPTAEPVEPTAEPTEEPTAEPTEEPTAEPTAVAPAGPVLSLIPISGTVGITLTVHGEGWPSVAPVSYILAVPQVEIELETAEPITYVVQVTDTFTNVIQTDELGMFDAPLWLPVGVGLENEPEAWVIGRTEDGQIEVITTYTVVTMPAPTP